MRPRRLQTASPVAPLLQPTSRFGSCSSAVLGQAQVQVGLGVGGVKGLGACPMAVGLGQQGTLRVLAPGLHGLQSLCQTLPASHLSKMSLLNPLVLETLCTPPAAPCSLGSCRTRAPSR